MLKRLKTSLSLSNLKFTPKTRQEFLDADDIKSGFDLLSKNIQKASPSRVTNPIHIVVGSGTCSVLVLHNRLSTRAIDFFNPDPEILNEIFQARFAAHKKLAHLPADWINADMIAFVLNHAGCETLFADSVAQDHVLYRSEVLVVFAADWRYQLVGKIPRAYEHRTQLLEQQGNGVGAYDELDRELKTERNLLDAVCILRLLVERNQGRPLDKALVRTWYAEGPALKDVEIDYTNQAYDYRYNEGLGIV